MMSREDQVAFDESLKFFGSISASLSHQINNVFAIINELAGLMDDFLLADGGGQEGKAGTVFTCSLVGSGSTLDSASRGIAQPLLPGEKPNEK